MSTNQSNNIVLFRQFDSEHELRSVQVIEHSNEHSHTSTNVDFGDGERKDVHYYPRTFARMEILHKYLSNPFDYADITITNRFTMDSTKFTVKFVENGVNVSKHEVINDKKASTYISQVFADAKVNDIQLVLSMYDFMYGDVCVQFYEDERHKDQYDAPIIFQFTNAPTVFTGDIYKMLPGDTEATSAIEDYDNVFSSAFGTKSLNKADSGRTNALLPTAAETECYNDFLSANRLMTNGCMDPNTELDPPRSLSGHPTYVVEYTCIVPSAFSSAFGIRQRPVDFVPFNNDEHAYLTLSADNLSDMYGDTQSLNMTTNANAFSAHVDLTVFSASNDDSATTMDCAIRKYTAYLATSPEDRHNDAWFRDHKRLCADFVLTGLDPYWTGESDELPVLITDRLYYVFNNASYTPNVFELSWFAAGAGTSYYLVKKCPTGQDRNTWINDTANWIQVFTKENRPEYLLSDKTICADNKTVMCKENDPVAGQASNGVKYITDPSQCIYDNIEDIELDNNGRPLVVHETYQTYGVLHGRRSFSDNSRLSYEAYPSLAYFRIISETSKNGLHAVVYRVSDNGNSDSNFELDDADAEFAVIYRA